jgi:hypothetical protein
VCRGGSMTVLQVSVQDLHAVSPWEFVEFSGSILQHLHLSAMRNGHLPLSVGVYVSQVRISVDARRVYVCVCVSAFACVLRVRVRFRLYGVCVCVCMHLRLWRACAGMCVCGGFVLGSMNHITVVQVLTR